MDAEEIDRSRIKRTEHVERQAMEHNAQVQARLIQGGTPELSTKAEILAAALELCEHDIQRQEHIMEEGKRRTEEIKARCRRKAERDREKREREQKLLDATSIFACPTASTPQPTVSASSRSSPQRSATSLKKVKSFKKHREVLSQEDLDRQNFERRKLVREQINQRRLDNIAKQAEMQRIAKEEKEQFELHLQQQALEKEERLLKKELEEKRHHFFMLDHIAAPAATDNSVRRKEKALDAAVELSLMGTLNGSTDRPQFNKSIDSAKHVHDLLSFMKIDNRRKLHESVEHHWREKFHYAALQQEAEDAQRAHQEKMEHLERLRQKQLQSLAAIQERQSKEKEEQNKKFNEELRMAEQQYLKDVQRSKSRFETTRDDEHKRLQRIEAAKHQRQKEINARVLAMKAKDAEELQQAMQAHACQQQQLATEAMEERERRIQSVQKMHHAQYRKAEAERTLQWEQSQRLREAEEQRQQEAAEKRRTIEKLQMRHAGNMLRYRAARHASQELAHSDTEAFYATSVLKSRKPRPGDTCPNSSSGTQLRLPPHKELRGLDSFADGDFAPEVLESIRVTDEKLYTLQKQGRR